MDAERELNHDSDLLGLCDGWEANEVRRSRLSDDRDVFGAIDLGISETERGRLQRRLLLALAAATGVGNPFVFRVTCALVRFAKRSIVDDDLASRFATDLILGDAAVMKRLGNDANGFARRQIGEQWVIKDIDPRLSILANGTSCWSAF